MCTKWTWLYLLLHHRMEINETFAESMIPLCTYLDFDPNQFGGLNISKHGLCHFWIWEQRGIHLLSVTSSSPLNGIELSQNLFTCSQFISYFRFWSKNNMEVKRYMVLNGGMGVSSQWVLFTFFLVSYCYWGKGLESLQFGNKAWKLTTLEKKCMF